MAPATVGIYALALNLSFKAQIVNQSLRSVLLPEASALSNRSSYRRYITQNLRRSLLFAIPLILLLPLARPLIPLVYGEAFAGAIPYLYGLMFLVLLDIVTSPLLLLAYPLDMPRLLATSEAVRLTTMLLLGVSLIPLLGVWGAIVAKGSATLLRATLLGLAILFKLRRQPPRTDGS
jgi:O-antigen/teichoic acid export membrane protein